MFKKNKTCLFNIGLRSQGIAIDAIRMSWYAFSKYYLVAGGGAGGGSSIPDTRVDDSSVQIYLILKFLSKQIFLAVNQFL